jgi:hypothetical protein
MRYYVACLHVAPGAKDERGLWLDRDELRVLAAKAGGAPLTLEHQGVHEAVEMVGYDHVTPMAMHAALAELGKGSPSKSAIGSVLSAFIAEDGALWCTLMVDETRFPRIDCLISRSVVRGVSLTHQPGSLVCVEVTLTADPARVGAHIHFATGDIQTALLYAECVQSGKMSSAIQTALAAVPAADRELITERLITMSAAASKANDELARRNTEFTALKVKHDELVTASTGSSPVGFDTNQLQQQLLKTINNIDPKFLDLFYFAPLPDPPADGTQMTSANLGALLDNCNKAMMCCSAAMMKNGGPAPEERKRARTSPEPTMTPLQRAIAEEWTL